MARSLVALLVGLLALACATGALATTEPAPEPTDPEEQFELGKRYAFGLEGTQKNPVLALKWFRLAAEQGHPRAQTQIGMAYQMGRGVKRDREESIEWFRLAADQGHAKAQFELGVAYRDGKGVPRDPVLGMMWLLLSQQEGGVAARFIAPGLARRLKQRDRKEAWELVYQWREAHGLPRVPPRSAKPKVKRVVPSIQAPAPKPGQAPAPEPPPDSEAAPQPQEGAPPPDAPPQEGDGAPST